MQTIANLKIALARSWKVDARRILKIEGTEYKLAVPHHMKEFQIGRVRFVVAEAKTGNRFVTVVRALDPIPASWFVDLSADVVEEQLEECAA